MLSSQNTMRSDYEEILIDLLTIESVADKPEKLVEALEFLLKLLPPQFTIEKFESNGKPSALIYFGPDRPDKFEVLFNAHLDVVPAKPEQFKPYKKGGKLYARGACDMKSAALVMTLALIDMAEKINSPVGLQLVTDEELGGNDGTGYQMQQGLKAEFVIIGEHTDMEINTESKGVCMLELTTNGKTAHGAYQWQGTSAIDVLLHALTNLRKAYPIRDQETWETTLNIAVLSTPNTAINALADKASAQVDFRFVSGDPFFSQNADTILGSLNDIADETLEVNVIHLESEHLVPEDNHHVQLLADVLADTTKKPARFVKKHGASDVRFYTQKGIDGITFGPLCKNPHCDDECVEMAGLQTYYGVLCRFLERL